MIIQHGTSFQNLEILHNINCKKVNYKILTVTSWVSHHT